jgi:RNA polymerase sigma-70 factor (ECF subfamily)
VAQRGSSAGVMRASAREAAVVLAPDADSRLLERCRRGDASAFEEIFRKYHTYVYNVCLGMLGNGDDAADVTQETFLRIHRSLGRFRGDASFTTWLYRVAVNLCISELRRRARSRLQYLDDLALPEEDGEHDPHPSPHEAAEAQENRRTVQQILRALPPDYRAIMVLRHFQQLAYEEIAEVLELSLSQVKTRLFRARRMFKDRYKAYMGDDGALFAD